VVKDLADLLHATPNEIIKGLISNGIFANINQIVEYDKAALVAKELGFEPSQSAVTSGPAIQSENKLSANEEMMAQRGNDNTVVIPPVVTIMGHVDHGKTSLLDTIRKTKVAAGEAGGITQHIGAYQVEINGKKITFLDTPGHEAFTAMRARGAQVTHIAVIVVAADDGVMPQTREAISHAQAAKVPIIIALNKIDKDNANPEYVKQQLAEMGVVIEEYGGDVGCIPVSARKGIGIDDLLEYILLLAEVQDIRANPNRLATGVIIEARLEKNSGPTATVLVQQGTLKMGDNIVVGALAGKVRAMFNDRGKRIQKAPPSTPVSIIGLPEVPQAGDRLEVAPDERTAKQRALAESEKRRDETGPLGQVSLDTLYMQMQQGKVKELNIVLKCDVQGSSEAIKNALTKVGEDNLKVRLIHEGIGNISETDVHLAAASGAIIIGFNVKADGASLREAQKEGVDIRYYNVIYKLTDDIQAALNGMLEPTYHEVVEGHAEVIQTFKAGKNLVIAGCRVIDGKITRSSQARLMRKNEKVHEGKIGSLRRGKDDVREIATGYECGIVLEEFNEFEVGDVIEAFNQERVK
jgi:translation initiation factor IF-2